jgi:predicted nucleic acid-binding protein
MSGWIGVDTNVLLRVSNLNDPQFELISGAIGYLGANHFELCFTAQNIREFWNVSTRPLDRNGYGLSVAAAEASLQLIERTMRLLPDSERVYAAWRRMLIEDEVKGVQVHDAYLAAVLKVHRVRYLLTFNAADFKRFPEITAVHPADMHKIRRES